MDSFTINFFGPTVYTSVGRNTALLPTLGVKLTETLLHCGRTHHHVARKGFFSSLLM